MFYRAVLRPNDVFLITTARNGKSGWIGAWNRQHPHPAHRYRETPHEIPSGTSPLSLMTTTPDTDGSGERRHIFDRDGDLTLEIGPHRAQYRVCSRALSRASPVFKAMLYGRFTEASAKQLDGLWSVVLPEDDPDTMRILLNITHGYFDEIPSTLAEEELLKATLLTHKYDMTGIFRPWALDWVNALIEDTPSDLDIQSHAHRVWIAWELGSEEIFDFSITSIIWQADSGNGDSPRSLSDEFGVPLMEYECLMPMDILSKSPRGHANRVGGAASNMVWIGTLEDERQRLLKAVLEPFQELYARLLEPLPLCTASYTQNGRDISGRVHPDMITASRKACDAFLFSSFTQSLTKNSLLLYFQGTSVASYRNSVAALRDQMSKVIGGLSTIYRHKIENRDPASNYGSSEWLDVNHTSCSPQKRLNEAIRRIRVYSPLKRPDRMAKQAEKLNLLSL